MAPTIFWDVDTQLDFIMPEGSLYINGAEILLPNLAALTDHARRRNITIAGSVDYHDPGDHELSDKADFKSTFPPHCLQGTPGQEKVPATAPRHPLWIDSIPLPAETLERLVEAHDGEIYFRKQRFDVFTNPNVEPVLRLLAPGRIVVYGVALDVCDAHAVEGFLARDLGPVVLVEDAVQAIVREEGERLKDAWRGRGVAMVSTAAVLADKAF